MTSSKRRRDATDQGDHDRDRDRNRNRRRRTTPTLSRRTTWRDGNAMSPCTITARASTHANDGTRVTTDAVVELKKDNGVGLALVRRVFRVTFAPPSNYRALTYAHVHYLDTSPMSDDLFLRAGRGPAGWVCQNVPAASIQRVLDRRVSLVADVGALTWRDPQRKGYEPPRDACGAKMDPVGDTVCDGCLSKSDVPRILVDPPGFEMGGETYHVGELVFFAWAGQKTGDAWEPRILVHGTQGKNVPVVPCASRGGGATWPVRRLGRVNALEGMRGVRFGDRDLYLTDIIERRYISDIMTKAPLNAPLANSWTCKRRLPGSGGKRDLVTLAADIRPLPCSECFPPSAAADERAFGALRLPAADLYAGGGGSVHGVNQHFDVKHAVDTSAACCETLRANFPRVDVHESTVAAYSASGAAPRGSLAFMVAGPPCQGHSRANHNRGPDDIRNSELYTALAEVERARPDVFVLENVPGMKDSHSVGGRDSDDAQVDDVNYVRDAAKRLLGMGYQLRIAMLNAREYGSPQRRLRLFILAVRRGMPLPPWPVPTHGNEHAAPTRIAGLGSSVPELWVAPGPVTGCGVLPAVTAIQALSDLPRWEYSEHPTSPYYFANPVVGVPGPVAYPRPPASDYQHRARGRHVRDHVTASIGAMQLDRVYTAPRVGDEPQGFNGKDRRLAPNGPVCTLLTSPVAGGKGTGVIHWSQHRLLTVLERKRVQGFPDDYVLCGTLKEKDAMIGNAINVTLMSALAEHIKREVYFAFWKEHGRPDSDRFWDLWRETHPA